MKNVNLDKVITYSGGALLSLLLVAFVLKIKVLIVVAEILGALLFISILAIAVVSIGKKYNLPFSNKNDTKK